MGLQVQLLKKIEIAADTTMLEAIAALRSIVWRDRGGRYEAFSCGQQEETGIETPARKQLLA